LSFAFDVEVDRGNFYRFESLHFGFCEQISGDDLPVAYFANSLSEQVMVLWSAKKT
jgi:hypothetical protein